MKFSAELFQFAQKFENLAILKEDGELVIKIKTDSVKKNLKTMTLEQDENKSDNPQT